MLGICFSSRHVDLLPIESDTEKKEKCKTLQTILNLLGTLLLTLHVMNKTTFYRQCIYYSASFLLFTMAITISKNKPL